VSKNQRVTPAELTKIRNLEDFDLIMLISEIHDHGWLAARATLVLMPPKGNLGDYLMKMETWNGTLPPSESPQKGRT
jgi:hypothetical protein